MTKIYEYKIRKNQRIPKVHNKEMMKNNKNAHQGNE